MGIIYRLLLLVLFIMPPLSVPYAQETESGRVTAEILAEVSAEQAQADRIATEITKALEDEPFTVEKSCDHGDCVITLQME